MGEKITAKSLAIKKKNQSKYTIAVQTAKLFLIKITFLIYLLIFKDEYQKYQRIYQAMKLLVS